MNNGVVCQLFGIDFTWEGIGIATTVVFFIITILGSLLSFWLNKKFNNKKLSINYITDKRVAWIEEVRNAISYFSATVRPLYFSSLCPDADLENDLEALEARKKNEIASNLELRHNVIQHATRIKLLMNFCGVIDMRIINYVDKIRENIELFNLNDIYTDLDILTDLTQIYLKLEWNRVKYEVEGKYSNELKNTEAIQLCDEMLSVFNVSQNEKRRVDEIDKLKQKLITLQNI